MQPCQGSLCGVNRKLFSMTLQHPRTSECSLFGAVMVSCQLTETHARHPSVQDANKKTLVLDLDETLVHSSFKPIPDPDYIIPVEIEGKVRCCNLSAWGHQIRTLQIRMDRRHP